MSKIIMVLALLVHLAIAKEKVSIMLEWFVNPDHAALVVAKQRGYFAEQGLEVNILEPADPADPPKFVAAGKIDYIMHYQNVLVMQAAEGWDLVRVATMIDSPLNSLVLLKNAGIKSIADLKGKKIGFSLPGFENAILKRMLETHGVSLKDVELININWALSASLLTKKVDAVIGAYRNFELHEMDIEKHPGIAFYPEEHGVPSYDELILVTHKDKAKTETTKKLILALEKAVLYIKNHPKKAWQAFKAYKPKVLDSELNRRAWWDTIRRLSSSPAALDTHKYQRLAKFLQESEVVKKKVPALKTYAIDPFQD